MPCLRRGWKEVFGSAPCETLPATQILKQATSDNAELFELSGLRHPYRQGVLGLVETGAYADLLLVDGNPLQDIELMADPGKNFRIVMKDGVIYKNTL